MIFQLLDLLGSTFRFFLPLGFAAMAGLVSERSGVAQIALEGYLLIGALSAAATAALTGSVELALMVAALSGALFAILHAVFSVGLRSDQIVVGMAINLLIFGVAPFLTQYLFGTGGSTPTLEASLRAPWHLYFLFAVILLSIYYFLEFTRAGLLLKFAGENPVALKAAGYNPDWVRTIALTACGAICGLGGSVLTLMLASHYSTMMSSGRGFIALAALIIGGWRLFPTLGAALLFAFTEALQIRIQGHLPIPGVFVQMLPYLVAILALIKWRRSSQVPEGMGIHA